MKQGGLRTYLTPAQRASLYSKRFFINIGVNKLNNQPYPYLIYFNDKMMKWDYIDIQKIGFFIK